MTGQFTPGPWHYRPAEFDDWGYVRATPEDPREVGGIICQARDPKVWEDEQLNEHRRNKTDPWEANARLIAAAPELYEALSDVLNHLLPAFPALAHQPLIVRATAALSKARPETTRIPQEKDSV